MGRVHRVWAEFIGGGLILKTPQKYLWMRSLFFTLTPRKCLIFTHDLLEMTPRIGSQSHPLEISEISQSPQKNSSMGGGGGGGGVYIEWNGPVWNH